MTVRTEQSDLQQSQPVAVPLYRFQRNWIEDSSRFKIGLVCRQAGKSFMVALEAALDAVATGQLWVLLSAGERQSKELMGKAKNHLEAMGMAAAGIEESFFEDTRLTQLTIQLANGGRIVGLPANPQTARGFTGNVILDEFAFHRDSELIWKALFPTVSRGYKLRVVSTPQGLGNRFHRLWTADNGYSKHLVDIHQAVADGVPHDIDQLKAGVDDEDAWNQEYLCLFIDDASAWLSYELIGGCQDESLPGEVTLERNDWDALAVSFGAGRRYGGFDIARHRHLSVIWVNEELGGIHHARLILVMKGVSFSDQEQVAAGVIEKLKLDRMCVDASGLGMNTAEKLAERFGKDRVEPVGFTGPVKIDLATRTRKVYEERRQRIPADRALRDDLHSIKKLTTAAGNIRFDADDTKAGHADRFWANSLALMAADDLVKPEVFWV